MKLQLNEQGPKKFKDFTVGMDIEFVATDGYRPVDPKLHNYAVVKFGNMGWDGGGSTRIFELRPNYSYNPLDLVYNIRGILFEKVKHSPKFGEYLYHAGACYQDKFIGAHLHYGLSPEDKKTMDYNHITSILNNYLGIFSVLLEDREQGLKRRRAGYGLVTDEPYRLQPHGAEYRVCSSFLVSPHITNAFTCLFKTVAFEFMNNKSFPFRNYNLGDDFYKMDINKLRTYVPCLWRDIQKMQLYPKFRCYIDLIYSLISKGKGWTPGRVGVKEAWGIIYEKPEQPKYKFKPISMEGIWGKIDKKNITLSNKCILNDNDNF